MDFIRIKMMGGFSIFVNEIRMDEITDKTRKGAALMQMLIVNGGVMVSNTRLMDALWPDERSTNPENALKTLISRLRVTLNQISPDLGKCITAGRGGYMWTCPPEMTVDLYEINDIAERIEHAEVDDRPELYRAFLETYAGDLLKNVPLSDWVQTTSAALHGRYLQIAYRYAEYLKDNGEDEAVIKVCRTALEVDPYDESLHIELMDALVRLNRTNEAMLQYKHIIRIYYCDLGVCPGEKLLAYYKHIANNGKNLEFSLESISTELRESGDGKGAYICEYSVFKEIFNLQMRNLERLGSTMFLGLIQITDVNDAGDAEADPLKQDHLMTILMDVLLSTLRKGDTVSRFSTDIVALLLPMVRYETGRRVMERVKTAYYKRVPNSGIVFNYCIGPLSSQIDRKKDDIKG